MRPDIVNLRQFYASRLGRKVKRRLRALVRHYWPPEHGLHIAGVGYTTDLLPLPHKPGQEGCRIVALMPMVQGAIYWPVKATNHSVLSDEMRPPFMPSSLHRVLMVHGFEYVNAPDELLRIWWQLLAPGGRLLVMVPNRKGLWSRFAHTPFTTGTPYTLSALKELFNQAGFTVRDTRSVLFVPPSNHPLWLACFSLMEWLGMLFCPHMGGVLVVEAEKQIYANVRETAPAISPSPAAAMAGASAMTSSKNR